FWVWAFGWLGIHLPPEWTPVLSFLLFGSLLTIGQAFKFRRTSKSQMSVDKSQEKSFQLISWRTLFCFAFMLVSLLLSWAYDKLDVQSLVPWKTDELIAVSVLLVVPPISIVLFATHRLHATLSVFLITIFYIIIALAPLFSMDDFGAAAAFSAITTAAVLPVILLSVAPAKADLIFLALGLLLLIALNELSKLGLDVTAPKLHG